MENDNKQPTDFSKFESREEISQQLCKISLNKLGLILIRLTAYMEVGEHKTRQEFWEYLEKICQENSPTQLTVDQVLTGHEKAKKMTSVETVLDKVLKKI